MLKALFLLVMCFPQMALSEAITLTANSRQKFSLLSRKLNDHFELVVDYRRQERMLQKNKNFIESGLLHHTGNGLYFNCALGKSVGPSEKDWMGIVGIELEI